MKKLIMYFSTIICIIIVGILFPVVFKTDMIYTHLFYIAIALTTIWYPSYAILIGAIFAMEHICVEYYISGNFDTNITCRAIVIIFVSIMLSRICKLERNYENRISKLSFENTHDTMTGLNNRSYFNEFISSDMMCPVAIIIIDIDNLKFTNDTYGHTEGDKLIIQLAHILKETLPSDGTAARIGGDEFAVILQQSNNRNVEEYIKKINSLTVEKNAEEHSLPIKFSTGYSICIENTDIFDAIRKADFAMYTMKLDKKSKEAQSK